ncbi:MAG TPA: hypothetical protein VFO24_03780 [Usitatibacter sp.]|nr:hypothetical protein [Usitatibacter sp.]
MTSWIGQIDSATATADVVAIVRDYIAMWSPEEIAALPVPVRPGRVRDEADVADLHERLVEAYRTTRATGDALATLQRLTGFMARASVRIAELGGATRREPEDDAPSYPRNALSPGH